MGHSSLLLGRRTMRVAGRRREQFQTCRTPSFHASGYPQNHIHRIWGEQEPKVEAERYSEMVKWELPGYSNMPRFDCTILGIGADGHVASIFSDSMNLLTDQRIYAVSHHPKTGQQRITMTGTVILKSSAILIPVIGPDKQEIMEHLVQKQGAYPASYIFSHALTATLFTDRVTE